MNNLLRKKVILIAEDDKNSRLLLKEFLSPSFDIILFAENGQEAVEIVKTSKVDLVLMDFKLPVLNGYEASKQIKGFSDVPVIAQTASILNDDIKNKLTKYFDSFILKPYNKKDLLEAVKKELIKMN
jgi:two-component system cell cycle response regulator DivK